MAGKTINKANLINQALVLQLGNPAKYSVNDETALSSACNMAWDETIYECFTLHDWTFCRKTAKLARLQENPENGYKYGFQLPGDRLGQVLRLLQDPKNKHDIVRDCTIEGNIIYCDYPDIWLRYKALVDPQYWDAAFRAAFLTALGGKLAIAVQQDEDLAARKYAEAFGTASQGGTGGKFGRLIAQDMSGEPKGSQLYWQDPLTSARWE